MLIGVDVGGTNLRVGVIENLRVVKELRYHTDFSSLCRHLPPDQAEQSILESLMNTLKEVLADYPDTRSIGIGFPGFIDPGSMLVASSPNLPGLLNIDLARPLSDHLKRPVIVENDGLAAAYGEYAVSSDRPPGLIYLGLGTGIGGGLIIKHKPYAGEHGVAMEVGHLIVDPDGRLCGCGNRGCMEQYASASGVTLNYKALTGQHIDAAAIAKLAEQGDAPACSAYEQAGDKLGRGLAHILKLIDVSRVVIGGGMRLAWPLMEPAFSKRLDTDLIPVLRGKIEVRISNIGDQAGMIGAALLAAYHATQSG